MHPRSVLAIARKDAIDMLLNKSTLTLLIMPIVLAFLFLFISKLIGGHVTNILVYNPGQSRLAQVVSGTFDPMKVTEVNSPADVTAAFGPNGSKKDSAYDVGLVIPANFESALQAGGHPQAGFYINENNVDPHLAQLLQASIIAYARQLASPQPPLALSTVTINAPAISNFAQVTGNTYGAIVLLMSFMTGTSLMPGLLIEEKEKKTLRMLMVTPASFTDVVMGKLLVTLVYQLVLSLLALAIMGSFIGQVPLLLLYTLLGSCFSLALGLLFGGIFSTASTAGMVSGFVTLIYVVPALFIGPLGALFGNSAFGQAMKFAPTYYIAEGAYNAIQNQGSLNGHLFDIGVVLGCTLALLAITSWVLRRQASVAAAI
ncbi:MAG TPA: ABC transporter permease [Ktedonobacteraceae bacterium]|nr:ABC transporter permease [Ktedonobacteraceae bacterium]